MKGRSFWFKSRTYKDSKKRDLKQGDPNLTIDAITKISGSKVKNTAARIQGNEVLQYTPLGKLLETGEGSDVSVFVGEELEEYKLHRAILCHNSGYFRQMLNSGFKEACEGKIYLPEHDAAMFEFVTHWLYHGEVIECKTAWHDHEMWAVSTWAQTLQYASYFQIPGLKTAALDGFIGCIRTDYRKARYLADWEFSDMFQRSLLTLFPLYAVERELVDKAFAVLYREDMFKDILARDELRTYLINDAPEVMIRLLEISNGI